MPWRGHFPHDVLSFLPRPGPLQAPRSPRGSPGVSGCWRRALAFTLVISPWRRPAEWVPLLSKVIINLPPHLSGLHPGSKAHQHQTPFRFSLISSPLRLMPPSLSLSHSSLGKRKCLQGIRGKVYQKSRWRLSLDSKWSLKFHFSLVLGKKKVINMAASETGHFKGLWIFLENRCDIVRGTFS